MIFPTPKVVRAMTKFFTAIGIAFFVSSCAIVKPIQVMLSAPTIEKEKTLADLQSGSIPEHDPSLPSTNLKQLRVLYLEALNTSDDIATNYLIRKRLAAIDLELAENEIAKGNSEKRMLDHAINSYEQLLDHSNDGLEMVGTLYQLAKAYDLNGELDSSVLVLRELVERFGESEESAEANFRLAEYSFSSGNYREADQYYSRVIEQGRGKFYENARYMLAWSQFKMTNYEEAIELFVAAIDGLVVEYSNAKDLQSIPLEPGVREIVNDCLKMISVSLSSLDGVETLAKSFTSLERKFYIADLYDELATYYLGNDRYSDSAKTYEYFIDRFPLRDESFRFRLAQIRIYQRAGFTSEILHSKEIFVEDYSRNGKFWATRGDLLKGEVDESLKVIIPELASYYHTLAQRSQKLFYSQKNIDRKKQMVGKRGASRTETLDSIERENSRADSDSRAYFLRAAQHYNRYVDGFPNDPKAPEMAFLMAESQMQSGQFVAAIESYEMVSYHYADRTFSAEAGYAAILAYEKLSPLSEAIQAKKIASVRRFSFTFSSDKRTPLLLLQMAQNFLDKRDFGNAISMAESLVAWPEKHNRVMDVDLTRSGLLVIAQSAFDSEDYARAELNYEKVLDAGGDRPEKREDLLDRYAASIYKQAEQARTEKDPVRAARHFDRIIAATPNSKIRISAQFEAGNSYLKAQSWSLAIDRLTDFRRRFPKDAMVRLVGSTLVVAYRELESWGLAADELRAMSRGEVDEVRKAQFLFLAAELYEKSGDIEQAIVEFRDYAHHYPIPVDINFEAMNKLNEFYQSKGDRIKRRFWLRKMIETQAKVDDAGTVRTNTLAAMASSVLAEDANDTFRKIKLTLPIRNSLSAKKAALELVIKRYRETLGYQVAEYTTLSSFHLAEVYAQLSRDLINSERPTNLDALALEQYELLLEEEAFPFEEKAIELHEKNIRNSWSGVFDHWVKASFSSLAALMPLRYEKRESYNVEGIF